MGRYYSSLSNMFVFVRVWEAGRSAHILKLVSPTILKKHIRYFLTYMICNNVISYIIIYSHFSVLFPLWEGGR